jgi:hypothetical protein
MIPVSSTVATKKNLPYSSSLTSIKGSYVFTRIIPTIVGPANYIKKNLLLVLPLLQLINLLDFFLFYFYFSIYQYSYYLICIFI